MNTKITAGILGILILIALGSAYAYIKRAPAPYVPDPAQTVSSVDDQTIRALVAAFGNALKSTSLLAPNAEQVIAKQYAPFIAPELLSLWKASPKQAPGRLTSSPWPDRIEIVDVAITGGRATVGGNIIEVTSADEPNKPAAVYPVAIGLEKRGGQWLITSLDKGAYSELPKQVDIAGVWECLPHKNTTGPQTTECAFGVLADDGNNYAIDTRLMAEYPVDYATGTRVKVQGTLTPVEALNSIQKYNIKGVISATKITEES